MDVNLTDGLSHNLELYLLDYNTTSRSEQIQLTDANTHAVLDTQNVSSFHTGVYLSWTISGNVLITITKTGGANAVLSGLFFDPSRVGDATSSRTRRPRETGSGPTARRAMTSSATRPASPSYATVTPSGQSTYTWATSTTDPRALQNSGGTGRIAAAWYSRHQLHGGREPDRRPGARPRALPASTGTAASRTEQVQISDATTGAVLNTQTVSSFHSGVYLTGRSAGTW